MYGVMMTAAPDAVEAGVAQKGAAKNWSSRSKSACDLDMTI
jgi:hypothetical protein